MFMAIHVNPRHLPWLLAVFAVTLTVGVAMLLS